MDFDPSLSLVSVKLCQKENILSRVIVLWGNYDLMIILFFFFALFIIIGEIEAALAVIEESHIPLSNVQGTTNK